MGRTFRQTGHRVCTTSARGSALTIQPTRPAPTWRPPDPVGVFGRALTTRQLRAHTAEGEAIDLPVADWLSVELPGDAGLLARCMPPTLDVGCGPGRLAAALQAGGVHALGVDVSPHAVAHARSRGASAICRSVFDELPAAERWESVLLADGNIGIGGDPVVLLRRLRGLLSPTGAVYAELGHPSRPTRHLRLRLDAGDGRPSTAFDWSEVGAADAAAVAAVAGYAVTSSWSDSGRWFAELRPY